MKKRKPTGELALFKKIWAERLHFCEVCGRPLKVFMVHNFSHVHSKGAMPSLRLNEENIVLMCWNWGNGCHEKWDTKSREDLKNDLRWRFVFEKFDKLKQEYYAK